MKKIKNYFRGRATAKAYRNTFIVSLVVLFLVAITWLLFAEVTVENGMAMCCVIVLIGCISLRSQNMYYNKKGEEEDYNNIVHSLTDEWQYIVIDYNSDMPDIIKNICGGSFVEAKMEGDTIVLRYIKYDGEYGEEIRTKDYKNFNKYFCY